jgi:hypothetical protein
MNLQVQIQTFVGFKSRFAPQFHLCCERHCGNILFNSSTSQNNATRHIPCLKQAAAPLYHHCQQGKAPSHAQNRAEQSPSYIRKKNGDQDLPTNLCFCDYDLNIRQRRNIVCKCLETRNTKKNKSRTRVFIVKHLVQEQNVQRNLRQLLEAKTLKNKQSDNEAKHFCINLKLAQQSRGLTSRTPSIINIHQRAWKDGVTKRSNK